VVLYYWSGHGSGFGHILDLYNFEASTQIIISDGCNSGEIITGPDNKLARDGRVILTACRADEGAVGCGWLDPTGVFTYFLIQALYSNCTGADVNKDGLISAEEAFYYAAPRVPEFLKNLNIPDDWKQQHPQIYDYDDKEEVPLTKCRSCEIKTELENTNNTNMTFIYFKNP
ncbi:MAG: hypothetical protein H5T45_06855, partial [Thermoplasmatales archaeon]|nr:hypothetical protein [Thermoplasmatales archaeon]